MASTLVCPVVPLRTDSRPRAVSIPTSAVLPGDGAVAAPARQTASVDSADESPRSGLPATAASALPPASDGVIRPRRPTSGRQPPRELTVYPIRMSAVLEGEFDGARPGSLASFHDCR